MISRTSTKGSAFVIEESVYNKLFRDSAWDKSSYIPYSQDVMKKAYIGYLNRIGSNYNERFVSKWEKGKIRYNPPLCGFWKFEFG